MLGSINSSLKSKWISSLEEPVTSDSTDRKVTLKDLLVDEDETSNESVMDYRTLVEFVKKGLMKLTERERNIILLRYDVIQAVEPRKTGE